MRQQALVCDRAVESQRHWRRINGRRVWWRAGASLGALAVLLGGCAGTDSAEPAEPTSPEEATVPDESETGASGEETAAGPPDIDPPERPDIERDDDIGAQNAAEYFLELYSYAFSAGSSTDLERISGTDCQFCAGVINRAREMSEAGEYYEGGNLVFEVEETYPPIDGDPRFLVRFSADQEQIVHRNSDGEQLLRSEPESDIRIDVALRFNDGSGHWVVDGVEIDAEE